MLIDTHAHLNFEAYNDDLEQVIKRCQARGMAAINVGAQYQTSLKAAGLAKENDNFFATLGLHPIHVFDEPFQPAAYESLLNDKVVAIGETGLDYYHPTFERPNQAGQEVSLEKVIAKQKEVFSAHIALAKKHNLPLMLHGRNGLEGKDVYAEMLEILKQEKADNAVFHCFAGNLAMAKTITGLGFYIGIDGPITFKKKAEELQKIAKTISLDKILLETDAPYLTPEPFRGQRNEPIYVEYVAEKIAELRGLVKEAVIEQTWQNAKKLFKI